MQILPDSSCTRKETVDIDILVTEKSDNLSKLREDLPQE